MGYNGIITIINQLSSPSTQHQPVGFARRGARTTFPGHGGLALQSYGGRSVDRTGGLVAGARTAQAHVGFNVRSASNDELVGWSLSW